MSEWGKFLAARFDLLFATALFLFLFYQWTATGNPAIKDFVVGLFGALLATLNSALKRQPPTINADIIRADNIEAAKTESGDIITNTDPKTLDKK